MACSQFWLDRIEKTKLLIIAYEDAISSIQGGVKSYMLDTGQGVQRVERNDIDKLNDVLDSLLNRLATMEARCGITKGVVTARPYR
jgi:hypothetical protein